jgi:hypothetical protein
LVHASGVFCFLGSGCRMLIMSGMQ